MLAGNLGLAVLDQRLEQRAALAQSRQYREYFIFEARVFFRSRRDHTDGGRRSGPSRWIPNADFLNDAGCVFNSDVPVTLLLAQGASNYGADN